MFWPRFKVADCDLERCTELACKQKHKINREALTVSLDLLIESLCCDFVDSRQICVQYYSLRANHADDRLY